MTEANKWTMFNHHTWQKLKSSKQAIQKPKSSEVFNQTPCRQKLNSARHEETYSSHANGNCFGSSSASH